MAQSYAALQQQIARLQEKAEAIKSREVGGVIAKIKDAIAFYNLKPQDLFGGQRTKAAASKPKKARPGAAKAKYSDGNGNSWIGRGKRPEWLKSALAQGKKLEDFLV